MIQTMLPMEQYGEWIVTNKCDAAGRRLADRHYSRVTKGAKQFTRPGTNLVLRTSDGESVWCTWRSNFKRMDGYDAWECTVFRNDSNIKSSELIRHAIYATISEWHNVPLPKDGLITYVDESKVNSQLSGYCFLRSGFKKIGKSTRNLLLYQTDLHLAKEEYEAYNHYLYIQELIHTVLNGGELDELDWVLEQVKDSERRFLSLQRKRKAKGVFSEYCIFSEDELEHLFSLTRTI